MCPSILPPKSCRYTDSNHECHFVSRVCASKEPADIPKSSHNDPAPIEADVDNLSEAQRGRPKVREAMWKNLQQLVTVASGRDFWKLIRKWSDPCAKPAQVSTAQFETTFRQRMNPPHVLPDHFDIPRRSFNSKLSSSMPVNTMDTTRLRSFSRPVSLEDIRNAKDHIRRRGASAAIGIDLVNQREILAIPDEDLVSLFNHCLDANEIPRIWLTSLLAAIPKKDRDLFMPDSYRAIGLQSCMLKFLTLLIDRRLVEWMEDVDVLPDSQNGFRAHNRTHNNAFILRSAIETAHAQGKVLYVAFVDLENAFPSTDLATLWLKLQELGVGGPMFDWVRHMYRDMDYVVRMGSSCSNTF